MLEILIDGTIAETDAETDPTALAGTSSDPSGFESLQPWDVAIRYQDLIKYRSSDSKASERLTQTAVQGLLAQARAMNGHFVRRKTRAIVPLEQAPEALSLEWEASLETAWNQGEFLPQAHHWMTEIQSDADRSVLLILDLSLSMRGEKRALLLASSLAVALSLPSPRVALLGFDSQTHWIKRWEEHLSDFEIAERLLKTPPSGFTHLGAALEEAARTLPEERRRKTHTLLISDGRITEGSDPTGLAAQFHRLSTIKVGRDWAGHLLMQELASRGGGEFIEVRKLQLLPRRVLAPF